jgi:AraC family transcriptional activator of mtrCDE
MCGRFILSAAHDRLIRSYLPRRVILHAPENSAAAAGPGTGARVAGLVSPMRAESATENLGGLAMLNALSTALFAIALQLASEAIEPPDGLLAVAGNPRLVPALIAIFNKPARPWTVPELARRCNMSRATLIRHFQERLGRSASELLTDIRMTVAANALKTSDMSTGGTKWASRPPSGAECTDARLRLHLGFAETAITGSISHRLRKRPFHVEFRRERDRFRHAGQIAMFPSV